jgi:hypothetical protein
MERIHRDRANVAAITDAQGWAAVISGFRAEGQPPTAPIDLMPFPDELRDGDKDRKISRATAQILVWLDKHKKVPSSVRANLSEIIKEAKKLEG